jgi:hypothetical protein
MSAHQLSESDPRHHTANIKVMLNDLNNHLKEDIGKVDDPQARALFETTREVVNGLSKAFTDYEQNKPAWRH